MAHRHVSRFVAGRGAAASEQEIGTRVGWYGRSEVVFLLILDLRLWLAVKSRR